MYKVVSINLKKSRLSLLEIWACIEHASGSRLIFRFSDIDSVTLAGVTPAPFDSLILHELTDRAARRFDS